MQAGKQRGALPLIRKFNEHSERLLKSAMCAWLILISYSGSEHISQINGRHKQTAESRYGRC
jgi:hypothetical protein